MAGGFLSAPNMRSTHCWTVLHVSILAMVLLTLNAGSEDSECEVEIKVRRNTAHEAVLGEDLRINCTVVLCNNSQTISWYKQEKTAVLVNVSSGSHIKMELKTLSHLEVISYLIFQNILTNDSGEYRCVSGGSGGSVSHSINVSVHVRDDEHRGVTRRTDTNITDSNQNSIESLWLYMYPAAGILTFVIIVIIISVASMRGCKGKSKKKKETENQYMAFPMAEHPFPHASLQLSPRESPSAPPSRRSTRRKPLPSQPNELPLPRDNECLYSGVTGDRERQRKGVEEEGGSVVYAALNHQVTAVAAARPWRQQEESSEYAAIRIKDPTPTRH